ncbi:MAG: hypothetical protein DWH73_02085 [Planctomycetota bacterium]|nr:MAG: hypothetical protein DWH73_02085 [Planctomycetota bacterium]
MPPKSEQPVNQFQKAVEVLQKGREVLIRDLADEIIDRAEDFTEGGFLFQEFLENQGTKLHFLYLMVSQLEQSSEALQEKQRKPLQSKPQGQGGKRGKTADPESESLSLSEEEFQLDQELLDFEDSEPAPRSKPRRKKRRKIRTESSMPSPLDDE